MFANLKYKVQDTKFKTRKYFVINISVAGGVPHKVDN